MVLNYSLSSELPPLLIEPELDILDREQGGGVNSHLKLNPGYNIEV